VDCKGFKLVVLIQEGTHKNQSDSKIISWQKNQRQIMNESCIWKLRTLERNLQMFANRLTILIDWFTFQNKV